MRRLLFASILLFSICVCGMTESAFAKSPSLRDLKWLHREADVVAALTRRPAECLVIPTDATAAEFVRLGRVAFRSPVLLGGIASRVGLSCDSCHRNGHDNPMFFIAGISEEAGTADVTGSVFSSSRDDQIENAVPIPTLLDAASSPPFGTIVPAPDLTTFLHAAIVDEFQGQRPSASILAALEAYLGALKQSACPEPLMAAIRFESDARGLLETLDVVVAAFDRDDLQAFEFALLSLRAAMERVYERFPESVSEREGLLEASRALAEIRKEMPRKIESKTPMNTERVLRMLGQERESLKGRLEALRRRVEDSFYDADFLRRALAPDR